MLGNGRWCREQSDFLQVLPLGTISHPGADSFGYELFADRRGGADTPGQVWVGIRDSAIGGVWVVSFNPLGLAKKNRTPSDGLLLSPASGPVETLRKWESTRACQPNMRGFSFIKSIHQRFYAVPEAVAVGVA